jgi:glutamate synthase (NADPH/NADH) large chain
MTKGTVLVLGEVGYNIGAGMTGGVIYIYDDHDKLNSRLNDSYVAATGLDDKKDAEMVRSLLENHYSYTESPRAESILGNFATVLKHFKKIISLSDSPSQ